MLFRFVFFALCIHYACSSMAQSPHLRHFTVDEGLPSSFVYRIFQDSKGYIWVCTDAGIARYNGYNFETFTTANGLPNNDIWDFTEDSKGRIWLHSYLSHFSYYDYTDNKIHSISNTISKIPSISLNAFHEWQGDIWASSNATLLINTRTGMVKNVEYSIWGLNGHTSKSLLFLDKSRVFSHDNPLICILQSNKINFHDNTDCYGQCWNNENTFMYYFNDTIFLDAPKQCLAKHIDEISASKNNKLSHVTIVSDNKLLIHTQKNVFMVDKHLNHLPAYDFLQDYNTNAAMEDREGNLWISTKNDGLFMITKNALDSRLFKYHNTHANKQNLHIRAVVGDNTSGNIYFGTTNGNIYFIKNNKTYHIQHPSPFWGHIKHLFILNNNTLLALTNDYTLFIPLSNLQSKKEIIELKKEPPLSQNKKGIWNKPKANQIGFIKFGFKNIAPLKNGNIAVSTSQVVFELKQSPQHYYINPLNQLRTYALAQNDSTHILAGTPDGLKILSKDSIENIAAWHNKFALLNHAITDMKIDSKHNIWVATDGAGLYYISPQQQKQLLEPPTAAKQAPYTLIEQLKNTHIKSIFIDEQNQIWTSTNQGVYCINKQQNNPLAAIHRFSLAQGLPTNETFSVYADNYHAYIGTNKGLLQLNINKNKLKIDTIKPILYLTEFIANKKQIVIPTVTQAIVLPYPKNNIEIKYECLSYMSDGQITYSYRIIKDGDNANAHWEITTELKREFALLAPAHYRFELKATDINNNETTLKYLDFVISPPWWQQNWFYATAILLSMGCILLAYRIRIKYVRRQERGKNEFATMRLQSLQSQMNPHFINNTLTAIQLLIANADDFTTNEYLAKFAELSRMYLEASRRTFIPLSEELLLLNAYLDLEHLRFSDKFEYSVKVEPKITAEITEFPAMLLQPLAENAINNGILYLKNKGKLIIDISKEDNKLICIIDDNGIGRKASNEIKAKLKKTHQSRGLQIVSEIQSAVNSLGKMNIDMQIIDKVDANKTPQGTQIIITITIK